MALGMEPGERCYGLGVKTNDPVTPRIDRIVVLHWSPSGPRESVEHILANEMLVRMHGINRETRLCMAWLCGGLHNASTWLASTAPGQDTMVHVSPG
jgi:hypothetical protein